MAVSKRALLEEKARRALLLSKTSQLEGEIMKELFAQQLDFCNDTSKRKAVLGSRRAGKTEMWTRLTTVTALKNPRGLIRIWSSSRLRVKELLWANFKYLHARHGIKATTNDTELSITFENGAIIRLVGADRDQTAQKKRGEKTALEIILESQTFGSFIQSLVEDVIEPSLMDLNGTLCMEGTPGPICAGYWFDVSGGEDAKSHWTSSKGWSCHRWTVLDNPYVPHARVWLQNTKREKAWADDNPTYLREYCGKWVNDNTALYYKFDILRNTYAAHEVQPWGKGWTHTLGWDLGFRDDMALVIWGWHPDYPALYEVFSWSKPGALAEEVMTVIETQERAKSLNLIEQVADTGGGGKMYTEEVMSRYTRRFTPAQKTNKYQHVMLFNDDLLTGKIKLLSGSSYCEEIRALMRDPEWVPKDATDFPKEHSGCKNHMCDSGLYSWRAATHYFKPAKAVKGPVYGTPEWVLELERKLSNEPADWTLKLEQGSRYGFGADEEA